MSLLWADKYRPKDLKSLDYHKQQAQDLKHLTQEGDFPHLLFYGPLGAGKKTRIMCLLKELFGPGVERLKLENLSFTTPSKKKLEIITTSSNYHIEVNPSDVGIYDRVVIMDVIKNVAQTQQLNSNVQREFKVVLLTDVDNLTKDAQHALRRTMEKYVANCRLILCAESISRVIPAIISRCLSIRVPAPSNDIITNILQTIIDKEHLKLPNDITKSITERCNRNLRRAILMLETVNVAAAQNPDATRNIPLPDWEVLIKKIAKEVLTNQTVSSIMKVREDLYELLINGIPASIVMKMLLTELLKSCDLEMSGQLIDLAAIYEHRMGQGNKEIVHLEAFVAKFMCLYQGMMQDLFDEF